MILISSSLDRPVFTSVSMPRSLKIATAAGDNLSEIRTLGINLFSMSNYPPPEPLCGSTSPRGGGESKPPLPLVGRGRGGGHLLFHLCEGPIEPGCERFDIGCFHGGAAPDAQTRRRGAIAADIQCDAFLFQKTCDLRGSFCLRLLGQSSEPRIDDLQAHAGVAACLGIGREEACPVGPFHPCG